MVEDGNKNIKSIIFAMEYEFDVFISYRQKEPDRSWVRNKIIPVLQENNLKVFVDYKHFKLGAPIIKEMERGIVNSKYTLAVLSPAYLESNFTEFESLISEHLGLLNTQRRLIAIMKEYCKPRISIQSKLWLDFSTEHAFNENVERLITGLHLPPD
jgi:hypothetical protein